MKRAASVLRWVAIALGAAGLVFAALVVVFTRTPWGVERVGSYAVSSIGRSIRGRLTVRRIESSSLLGGMLLRDVAITDSAGNPFVHVDSARASYDWRSLLGGQIVLTSLDLYQPRVVLEQIPGDTLWNYQKIFLDTTTVPGTPRLMRFSDVTVHGGEALVAFPFEQKRPIQPSDTARLIMRRAGPGLQRVMRFDSLDARLPDVLWESPQEPGRLVKVARVSGRGFVWTTPFQLRDAAGTVALHDSVVAFDVPRLQFPASRGTMVGRVVVHHESNDYDIRIGGDRLVFSDLGWLYPRLPRQGGGTGDIRILTVPKGTLWLIQNARLATPGTAVAGSFGIVTGDTLYFTQVSLRASPFDLKVVEAMLPGKLPVHGLLIGTVVVQGPLSALRTRGEMQLAGAGGSPSFVKWSGTLDARGPFGARNFRADIGALDLELLSALEPALKLRGTVSGSIDATGRLDRSLQLVADLQHTLPGMASSRMTGTGTVSWTRRSSSVDLRLEALPVALDALAQAFPALRRLEGAARGPVSVRGSLSDMLVDADLATPAGRVAVTGRFDVASKRPAFHAGGELTGFHLDRIVQGLPPVTVNARYRLDGSGGTLADMDAAVSVDLSGGRVGGVPVHDGTLRLGIRDGVATVDTFTMASAAGTVRGAGAFGLVAGRGGTLELRADADSLGALQPLFFADSTLPGDEARSRLGGTLRAHATLTGGVELFDVAAEASLARARLDAASLARAQLRWSGRALRSPIAQWKLEGGVDSLRLRRFLFPATTIGADYRAPAGSVTVGATGADGGAYEIAGDYRLSGDSIGIHLRDLKFGAGKGAWHLAGATGIRLAGGAFETDSLVLERAGGGGLRAVGRLAWAEAGGAAPARLAAPLAFRLDLNGAPIEDFLGLAGAASPAGGRVTGQLTLSGTAAAPRLDGGIAVDSVRFQELRLDRLDARLAFADRRMQARVQGLAGGAPVFTAEGRLPMDLGLLPGLRRFPEEPIDVTVHADSLPASLATTLLSGFSDVRGRIDGEVKVAGTVRDPQFNGELRLRDGAGAFRSSGVTYSAARGSFRMAGDSAIGVEATAAAGGGTADVTGRIVVASDWTNPRFDLAARLNSFLAARRRDADVTATGNLRLRGRYRAPVVSGFLRVDRGVLNVDEVWRLYNIVALDDSLLFNVVDTSVASVRSVITREMESDFMKHLVVDTFTVDVGRDAWLRGKQMNVEVSGNLGVFYDRAAQDLRLTGRLNAVRGNYLLYGGRRFDVNGGTVSFVGTAAFDPNLDITATYRTRTMDSDRPINIQANVTGTFTYPRVALSSDQAGVSQSDLVSYLLFGVPTYRLTPGQTRTMQLASGAITSSAFGYLSSGLENVARNVGFDYVSLSYGETAPRRADGTDSGLLNARNFLSTFTGAQVELGRYIGENLFLAASGGRNAFGSAMAFRGARLEWRFRPTWTGEFFIDDRAARVPSLGYTLDQTLAQQKVLGFFLYREWGY